MILFSPFSGSIRAFCAMVMFDGYKRQLGRVENMEKTKTLKILLMEHFKKKKKKEERILCVGVE